MMEEIEFTTKEQIKKDLERIKDMGSDVKLNKTLKNEKGEVYLKEWLVSKK